MYLFSLDQKCIEYEICLKDETFVSIHIDRIGFFIQTCSFKAQKKIYRIDYSQLIYHRPHSTFYSPIMPILWKESKIPYLKGTNFKIQHNSFRSFDGQNIPITIIRKDCEENPSVKSPCLVKHYGGFGVSMLPLFKLFFVLFIELFNGIVGMYAFQPFTITFYWILKSVGVVQ